MEQIRIGVIGVTGRGGLAAHWHQPEGRSVVAAGADISTEALERFREEVNKEPLAPPLAGRMSVAVGCAGTHSIRNGSCMVEIPPA